MAYSNYLIWGYGLTRLQKLQLRQSEVRVDLGKLLDTPEAERTDTYGDDLGKLTKEVRSLETDVGAAIAIGDDVVQEVGTKDSSEGKEYRELRSNVDFGRYVSAAMGGHGVTNGPELELNQHLKIADGYFPMEILAGNLETRAIIDVDAGASQGTWLDRVFRGTAAENVGISFRPVSPGVAAYPVTTAGGAPQQRGRTEAASARTYTAVVTEIKPARRAVHGVYSIEDDARLPGIAAAIERDMRMAMVESVDLAVFNGDGGANETTADIVGMKTAGITEATLTQTNKAKADETLKFFLEYVDGKYAASLSDVRIVTSVGANVYWYGSIHNSAVERGGQSEHRAVPDGFGLSWTARGGIDTNTGNGKFGAYIGLARGVDGAGIAAVWGVAKHPLHFQERVLHLGPNRCLVPLRQRSALSGSSFRRFPGRIATCHSTPRPRFSSRLWTP